MKKPTVADLDLSDALISLLVQTNQKAPRERAKLLAQLTDDLSDLDVKSGGVIPGIRG